MSKEFRKKLLPTKPVTKEHCSQKSLDDESSSSQSKRVSHLSGYVKLKLKRPHSAREARTISDEFKQCKNYTRPKSAGSSKPRSADLDVRKNGDQKSIAVSFGRQLDSRTKAAFDKKALASSKLSNSIDLVTISTAAAETTELYKSESDNSEILSEASDPDIKVEHCKVQFPKLCANMCI